MSGEWDQLQSNFETRSLKQSFGKLLQYALSWLFGCELCTSWKNRC